MKVDPAVPEVHREVLIVPFQDHVHNGVLHNGFGVEIIGADYANYRAGFYRAWLKTGNRIVVQLPTVNSGMTDHKESYIVAI